MLFRTIVQVALISVLFLFLVAGFDYRVHAICQQCGTLLWQYKHECAKRYCSKSLSKMCYSG